MTIKIQWHILCIRFYKYKLCDVYETHPNDWLFFKHVDKILIERYKNMNINYPLSDEALFEIF